MHVGTFNPKSKDAPGDFQSVIEKLPYLQGLGINARLNIKHMEDYRNYKVSVEKARNVLSFKARHDIKDIVKSLVDNMDKFKDIENPAYYNIRIFKMLSDSKAVSD
jgi:nucleoside-diphosphate-sugar epimerase